jgi:hypothetical protein
MRGGRRSRIRKSVSAAPARRRVRYAPKPKSPTRGMSAPVIPPDIMKQIQDRIQSLPKKAPAKKTKPAARRRPAVQPVRKKPAVKKPVARKKAPEINITADVPKSVRKRIQDMIASGRIKAPMTPSKITPKKAEPKKSAPKKVAVKKSASAEPKQQTQAQKTSSQTPAPQTPAPQAPTPPPTQQQTGGGSF